MPGYGQFCPVAKAAEVLTERWTLLIVRELLCGSTRFNDLRRGVPLMSPSLLSTRLKTLERAGVVERTGSAKASEYHLTSAGRELRPIVEQLGAWGNRWIMHELGEADLDPSLLMWDVRRWAKSEHLPTDGRTVVEFEYWGVPANRKRWWLVFDRGEVELCLHPPGFSVDLTVTAHIRTMVEIWIGKREMRPAIEAGDVTVAGSPGLASSLSDWIGRSPLAAT